MSKSKHIRKSGATTIKDNGKIVGNIGKGKTNIPTVQNSSIQKMTTVETDILSKSTILMAQQKMDNLSQNKISFEQAQTLWNLTIEQNLVERLNILDNYIDSLSREDKNKLLLQIWAEYREEPSPYTSYLNRVLQGESSEGNVSANILDVFAHCFIRKPDDFTNWKSDVARNVNTTPETLDFLASFEEKWIVQQVAKNPHTRTHTITKIFDKVKDSGKDIDIDILCYVARNENTSQHILEELSQIRNENTSQHIFDELTGGATRIRKSVAMNPKVSPEILIRLGADESSIVRTAVAHSRQTPVEMLEVLSKDSNNDVLFGVAGNPNATYHMLERLMRNSDTYIAGTARHNLNSIDR